MIFSGEQLLAFSSQCWSSDVFRSALVLSPSYSSDNLCRCPCVRSTQSGISQHRVRAETPDFKSAAAHDKSETVAAPNKTKKAKKAAAPKKLTSKEAGAARAAGMKLFACEGVVLPMAKCSLPGLVGIGIPTPLPCGRRNGSSGMTTFPLQ